MHGSGAEDRELAAAFLDRKDEEAFRELFRRHSPALHAFCIRFLGDGARFSEDVVQETWLRASAKLSGFGWRSSLRTWLVGIAVNCAREVRRREGPFGTFAEALADPPAGGTQPDLDLELALRSLPDGYREVLLLHDVQGLTHSEIAQLMGIEDGTSRSQLFRARRALRARWAPSIRERDTP